MPNESCYDGTSLSWLELIIVCVFMYLLFTCIQHFHKVCFWTFRERSRAESKSFACGKDIIKRFRTSGCVVEELYRYAPLVQLQLFFEFASPNRYFCVLHTVLWVYFCGFGCSSMPESIIFLNFQERPGLIYSCTPFEECGTATHYDIKAESRFSYFQQNTERNSRMFNGIML